MFSFFQSGSGPYPLHPVIGGGCQLESLPSFQWDPKSRLGTCPSPSGSAGQHSGHPATSDRGDPSCMRAIVIEGAGPVGQPLPGHDHHRRLRLAPRRLLFLLAVEAVAGGKHSGLGVA